MTTTNFKTTSSGSCEASKVSPDQKAVKAIISASKKKVLASSTIIIARYAWLKRNKLKYPEGMELPNLCLTVKDGKLISAFYSNVMTHIIKKQNYYIQILN